MSIGDRIKLIRGKTPQKVFAATLGIAQNTLGNYERNERTPNADVIVAIAQTCNVSFDWLLTGNKTAQDKFMPAQQGQPSKATCLRCEQLEAELREEREEVREIYKENRALWKENGDLKEKIGELRGEIRSLH